MAKIGIGIGVKIADIKSVKADLTKQVGNIKGIKANISDINLDVTDKMKQSLQTKLNSLSKKLNLSISGINFDDSIKEKLKKQIQSQLNSLGKEVSVSVKNVELTSGVEKKLQSKLNTALKGLVVKINNVEFDVTKIDTVIKKTKEASDEAKQLKTVLGSSLDIGDGAKSFEELQNRVEKIRNSVDSLAKVNFTTNAMGGIESAVITYTDKLNKVVTETMGWKTETSKAGDVVTKTFTTLKTNVGENITQLQKLEATVESTKAKLQNQLDVAKALGMDENVINRLQTQLNNLNTSNFNQQINVVKKNFQDLGVTSLGNITKLQNAINTMKAKLDGMSKSKLELIKDADISKLNEAKNQLKNLESLMNQIKTGKFIDGQVIASEISVAKNSFRELDTAIKQASDTGNKLKTVMSNIGSYALGGSALYFGLNELRNGISAIKDVDTAMRDLKRVTDDVSDETLDKFVGKANDIAKVLGSTTEEAISATTVWKQMGYSFADASEYLAKQSLILGNVGDMSASDSSDALVSTLKAFKLEAKDTEKVVDSLNEAGNKFAITTGDLAEGLRVGASSLALANNDLYESEALIVAGTEILRDSNTVANGLKTISMRLNQVKTAGGETFYKLKSELAGVGVALTDSNDNLRSTYDVILDLSEAWSSGKLDDMTKSKLLDDIAGKHQSKVLASIIQNAEQLPVIYDTLANSMGSAAKEQEVFRDSIEGRMNALTETSKSLWLNLVDSSAIKNFVSVTTSVLGVFDSLIKTVGGFPTIIATVVTALTLFNSKFRESTTMFANMVPGVNTLNVRLDEYKDKLGKVIEALKLDIDAKKKEIQVGQLFGVSTAKQGVELGVLSAKLVLTTAKQVACTVATVALQTAMSMGLSLAITGAISLLTSFGASLFGASNSMKDCTEQAKALSDELNIKTDTTNLMNQYDEINKKLKEGNLSEEERKKLNQQLQQTKNDIIGLDDEYKWILNDQNKTYEEQLTLLRAINEEKLKDKAKELDKSMSSQSSAEKLKEGGTFNNGLDKNVEMYKRIQEALANNNGSGKVNYDGFNVSTEEATKTLEKLEAKIKSAYTEIETYNHQVGVLKEANYDTNRSTITLSDGVQTTIKSLLGASSQSDNVGKNIKTLISSVNELNTRGDLSATSVQNLAKAFPSLGINAVNANSKIKEFQTNLQGSSTLLSNAQKELNDTGIISDGTLRRLSQAFPELQLNSSNAKDTLDTLNGALQDVSDSSGDNADAIAGATEKYTSASSAIAKAKDVIDKLNKAGQVTPAIAKSLTASYGDLGDTINDVGSTIDFLNGKIQDQQKVQEEALAIMKGDDEAFYQEKIANNSEFENYINDFLQRFVGTNNDNYNIDLSNYKTLNELKASSQDSLGSAIDAWMSKFINVNADGYNVDYSNFQTLIKAKQEVLKQFAGSMAQFWDDTSQSFTQSAYGGIDLSGKASTEQYEKYEKHANNVLAIRDKIRKAYDELDGIFAGGGLNLNRGLSGSTFGGGTPTSSGSSGSKGSTGSSGKSDAEKAAEEAEKYAEKIRDLNASLDLDRYYDVNNALTMLDNKLADVQASQEYLLGADLIKAKQEETKVIKEQMNAYGDLIGVMKQEQEELKKSLANYGFMTDATGQLIDAQSLLAKKQDEVNAKTYANSEEGYEAKQKDIEALKELQEQVQRYTEITLNEIPQATQTWNQLSASIRKTSIDNLDNLREKIVAGLKKQYDVAKTDELDKLDEKYKKDKELLEEEYQIDVDSITKKKEKSIKFYQDQIDALQKELDALNDDTEDKQKKLASLKNSLSQWQKDDSVFAKKKIEELNQQIAELEKDLLKDSIQNQIDTIKDKQDEESKYYDDKLDSLKESFDEESEELQNSYEDDKKAKEKYWKDMLTDQALYEKANQLIVSNSITEIETILTSSAENFKEIGSLLGQNFAESLKAEIEQAMNDFKTLTGQDIKDLNYNTATGDKGSQSTTGNSGSGSSWIADKGDDVWIADASSTQVYYEPGGASRGTAWQIGVASADQLKAIDYNDGYLKLQKNGETIGWVDRYLLNKWNDISSYATGGRTPSDIDENGALSILHKNEKILNAEETVMLDRIYDYVSEASGKLSDMDNAISAFRSVNDYILGNSGMRNTNINKSTSNNDQSKQVNLENTYNIHNYTKSDSTFSKRELEKLAIRQAKLYR